MDDLDRAKEREMADRDKALQVQLQDGRETEEPMEINGIRLCLDCYEVIPEERIKARPESVLCVSCKEKKETEERVYR